MRDLMAEDIRRARLVREMEEPFVPVYDASSMPSADKRAAYALEHIAFRMSKIDRKLDELVAAIQALAVKS